LASPVFLVVTFTYALKTKIRPVKGLCLILVMESP